MLSYDFDYFKPQSLQEAVELYHIMKTKGKKPLYYNGGTEILTLGRLNRVYSNAVIDLKGIPECGVYEWRQNNLFIGTSVELYQFEEKVLFPLLTNISGEIADYTARNKITIGGNICGQIFYREAILPFLLMDSQIVIANQNGTKKVEINEVFNQQLQLKEGEILVQIITKKGYITAPFISIKKRNQWHTGYPLVTVAAIKVDGRIRVAISGLCPYPFRLKEIEDVLNEHTLSNPEKVSKAMKFLPQPILNDVEGSKEYRLFVLKNTLLHILSQLGVK